MAITTLDELTALPEGTDVMIVGSTDGQDRTWTVQGGRLSDGKWNIRIGHLTGALKEGRVFLPSDVPPKPGVMYLQGSYYYLVTKVNDVTADMALFHTNTLQYYGIGQYAYKELSPHMVKTADLPVWHAMAVGMVNQLQQLGGQVNDARKQINAAHLQIARIKSELTKVDTLRAALKSLLDEPEQKPSTIDDLF